MFPSYRGGIPALDPFQKIPGLLRSRLKFFAPKIKTKFNKNPPPPPIYFEKKTRWSAMDSLFCITLVIMKNKFFGHHPKKYFVFFNYIFFFIFLFFSTSRNIKGFFGENWFWNYLTNNLSLQKGSY